MDSNCIGWAKQAAHRCLVYLGDLSRYVLDLHPFWDTGLAVRYYLQVIFIILQIYSDIVKVTCLLEILLNWKKKKNYIESGALQALALITC